ncbi:hypothetical protein C2W59_03834 [Bacillus pumilus]|nr:hypothetical protein C2W59_03834 [Bacillus pumilus]
MEKTTFFHRLLFFRTALSSLVLHAYAKRRQVMKKTPA